MQGMDRHLLDLSMLKVERLRAAGYHQPQQLGLAAITGLAWIWGG